MQTQTLSAWVHTHADDYDAVEQRIAATRRSLLSAGPETAGATLRASYVFSVLSIQTQVDRHERAFTAYMSGGKTLREATAMVVYGNQKADWIESTFADTDWLALAIAVRQHYQNERLAELLGVLTDRLTGVSYRKAAFMLAMAGLDDYLCIDTHVGRYADIDKLREFISAEAYLDACWSIVESVPATVSQTLSPFLVQWAVWDYQRGEHIDHLPFYREVLPLSELQPQQ